ncbi:TPA: PAC2 family protein [Candidatus Bathyarchaeota archaeon]|nr:PAC2 family protein [Candidatus Bathyarchaeota archaeon]
MFKVEDEVLKIDNTVHLQNSVMIIGLSGWGNAGEVSTFTVKYLVERLKAKRLGELSSEEFYNYRLQRPIVSIRRGIIDSYRSPKNEIYCSKRKIEDKEAGLILLVGSEPHLHWSKYARAILKVAVKMDVKCIYTIGGYLADIHHEAEPPITGSTNNESLLEQLKDAGVELTDYTGPTSVYSEILWQAKNKGINVVSLWCAVPIYIQGLYPKAAYFMLQKILSLIGIKLDLRDLKKRAASTEIQITAEALSNPQLRQLIESLKWRRTVFEKEPNYMI